MLHARNKERAKQALAAVPGAQDIMVADLSSIEEIKALAAQANALRTFDAVIPMPVYIRSPKILWDGKDYLCSSQ